MRHQHFFFKVGEISAFLYADQNDLENRKTLIMQKAGENFWICHCTKKLEEMDSTAVMQGV